MRDTLIQKQFPFQLLGSVDPGACLTLYLFIYQQVLGKCTGWAGLESLADYYPQVTDLAPIVFLENDEDLLQSTS